MGPTCGPKDELFNAEYRPNPENGGPTGGNDIVYADTLYDYAFTVKDRPPAAQPRVLASARAPAL